jgi:hypothetical protein
MEETPSLPDDILELGRALIPSPVFIVGCARSGTSIFGECLAAHPRVVYLFEKSTVWNTAVPGRPDHRLERSDATPEIAEPIYRGLARAVEEVAGAALAGRVVIEKNPKHVLRIGFLDALFPDARFLHIIRDGRDVTASLMFRNRGTEWGHLEIPGWRALLERYPEKNWLRCAHQWRCAVETARAEGVPLGPKRYFELRYEDLVADPKRVLDRVLAHLGLEPAAEVDTFARKIQDETAGSYHARKQVRHYVENHARRIRRFEENLTPDAIAEVTAICGDLLRELGYEA